MTCSTVCLFGNILWGFGAICCCRHESQIYHEQNVIMALTWIKMSRIVVVPVYKSNKFKRLGSILLTCWGFFEFSLCNIYLMTCHDA